MAVMAIRSAAHIALTVTEYGLTKALETVRLVDGVVQGGAVTRFLAEETGPRPSEAPGTDEASGLPAGGPRWRRDDEGDLDSTADALRARRVRAGARNPTGSAAATKKAATKKAAQQGRTTDTTAGRRKTTPSARKRTATSQSARATSAPRRTGRA